MLNLTLKYNWTIKLPFEHSKLICCFYQSALVVLVATSANGTALFSLQAFKQNSVKDKGTLSCSLPCPVQDALVVHCKAVQISNKGSI